MLTKIHTSSVKNGFSFRLMNGKKIVEKSSIIFPTEKEAIAAGKIAMKKYVFQPKYNEITVGKTGVKINGSFYRSVKEIPSYVRNLLTVSQEEMILDHFEKISN